MKEASIVGVHRWRKVTTTRGDPAKTAAPDLVRRRFHTDAPDRVWVSDITYVPTQAGYLYLAVVIDLWSRKVVGWSMRSDLTTPLVTWTWPSHNGNPMVSCIIRTGAVNSI